MVQRSINLDKVGACASAICAVHCLITGVALGLLSTVGLGFFGSIAADVAFLSVAVIIGSFAIIHGIKRHHSAIPAAIFATGLIFVIFGHFVFGHVNAKESTLATVLSVAGGLSFVTFHFVNLRLQKLHGAGCGCETHAQGAKPTDPA